jgi:hypothetical protein
MAIVPSSKYTGQIDTSDANYPQGKAQNVATAGDGTGTPLEKDWVNDIWGFLQALLDSANITPSGSPDKVGTSDYLDAINTRLGTTGNLVATTGDMLNGAWTGHVFDASTENTSCFEAFVTDAGTKMYVVGQVSEEINRYTLGTAWDETTATPVDVYSATGTMTNPRSIDFNPNGLAFIVAGYDAPDAVVQEFTLSSAWVIGSGVSVGTSWSPTEAQASTTCNAAKFNSDGSRIFALVDESGAGGNHIFSYPLGTDYTISTVGTTDGNLDVSSLDGASEEGIHFDISEDGTRLFVLGDANNLYEFHLPTADVLTNAEKMPHARSFDTPTVSTAARSVVFGEGKDDRAYVTRENDIITSVYSSAVRVA